MHLHYIFVACSIAEDPLQHSDAVQWLQQLCIFTTWECAAGGQFAVRVVQILCTASFVYGVWIIMDHGWSDCQQDNTNNHSTANNLQKHLQTICN